MTWREKFENTTNWWDTYSRYLASPEWHKKRKKILRRDKGRCRLCSATDQILEVHHSTYDRVGDEASTDLITLCKPCHEAFTRILRRRRRNKRKEQKRAPFFSLFDNTIPSDMILMLA